MFIEGADVVCSPADSSLENMGIIEVPNWCRERLIGFDDLR